MLPLLLAGLLVLVAAGCRVDGTVAVKLEPDGSGTVTVTAVLDQQAAARVPELAKLMKLDDLRAAGWTVTGPTAGDGGGATVSARKHFSTPAQAEAILTRVTGPDGPLRDVRVSRSSGFASSDYRVQATLDLHRGLDAFGDPALVKALGGTSLAGVADALRQPGDPSLDKELTFRLAVQLPGGGQGSGATHDGSALSWSVVPGASPVSVDATSTRTHLWRLVLLAVAIVALVLAAALAVLSMRRRGRGAHARPRRRR